MSNDRDKTEDTASLFTNGGSQAVRLPQGYRMPGERVRIRRVGNRVILEPLEKPGWPRGYWKRLEALAPLPRDFKRPAELPADTRRDRRLMDLDRL